MIKTSQNSLAIDSSVVLSHLCETTPPRELKQQDIDIVQALLKKQNAILISHYYTDKSVQMLTEATGGLVADSLTMTQFGSNHPATTLIVSGVRFMGETAKILNPHKRVLANDANATCSLDLLCPANEFEAAIKEHPDREIVVYINTSAEVKALADWVVTSSIAEDIIEELDSKGKKILWAPDRHLGHYLQQKTGADMTLWHGACIVHEEFKTAGLKTLKQLHPNAAVLAHPEAPQEILAMSDVIGSTSKLIEVVASLPQEECIVATDEGIFYKMHKAAPEKTLFIAPTAGKGATCRSCAHCPWMGLNSVDKIISILKDGGSAKEISIEEDIMQKAREPLLRMMNFSKQ